MKTDSFDFDKAKAAALKIDLRAELHFLGQEISNVFVSGVAENWDAFFSEIDGLDAKALSTALEVWIRFEENDRMALVEAFNDMVIQLDPPPCRLAKKIMFCRIFCEYFVDIING